MDPLSPRNDFLDLYGETEVSLRRALEKTGAAIERVQAFCPAPLAPGSEPDVEVLVLRMFEAAIVAELEERAS